MGTVAPASAPDVCALALMQVSVGPYRLTTSAPVAARARAASPAGSASPPQKTRRSAVHADRSSSSSAPSSAGTNCATVIRPSASARASRAGSRCAPGSAITSVAPAASGAQSSHTEASKLNGVFWSTRSAAESGKARCIHPTWLASAAWGTATPRGVPVEPEV